MEASLQTLHALHVPECFDFFVSHPGRARAPWHLNLADERSVYSSSPKAYRLPFRL